MATDITLLPDVVNLNLYAGDDFTMRIEVLNRGDGSPMPLAGYQIDSHIRPTPPGPLAAAFVVALDNVVTNVFYLHLTPDMSASLPASAVWDVQISRNNGANVTTLAGGAVRMTPDVTRLTTAGTPAAFRRQVDIVHARQTAITAIANGRAG